SRSRALRITVRWKHLFEKQEMLQEIIRTRRAEIEESRQRTPEEVLAERARRLEPPALEAFLTLPGPSVIAEIKYRSPSHGPFRCQLPVTQITQGYIEGGARALSILTDSTFFGGSLDNIWQVYERLHSPGEIAEEEEQEKQGVFR